MYHRDTRFREEFQRTKARLCGLAGAPRVEILLGSGTLANDVVAGQISLLDAPGVVVSNGEFGERLIDHARRMRLVARRGLSSTGARASTTARVEQAMIQTGAKWLWAVVSETSTGMLNDLDALTQSRAQARRGALPRLRQRHRRDATRSRRGCTWRQAPAARAGLAAGPVVRVSLARSRAEPARLPRYLDLGYYAEKDGIPFTHSSNLIAALDAALTRFDTDVPFQAIADLSRVAAAAPARDGLPDSRR